MNEQFFYSEQGERKGPVSIDEMKSLSITKQTLVWQKGMDDWVQAGTVEELQVLFGPTQVPPQTPPPPVQQPQNTNQTNQQRQGFPPKTYLMESILVTVFCCLPFGIAGIVNATRVESLFYSGNIEEAAAASREAKKWTQIGFYVALGLFVLYIVSQVLIFFGAFSLALSDIGGSF